MAGCVVCFSMAWALLTGIHLQASDTKPPAEYFDLSHWKLTLPITAPENQAGAPTEISAAQLQAGYSDSRWFHSNSRGEMVFWCPVDGATTKGSDYPRTELREVINPKDDNVCWSAKGTHVLNVRCRVTEIPSSGKVIVGQIHGYSGKARPLIKLQFYKGRVEALVKESPNKGRDIKLVIAEVGLDTEFDYRIRLHNGLLSITVNDAEQSINVFEKDPEWSMQTMYFKVGAYVQDNEGPSSEGARVLISRLTVSHSAATPRD